MKKVNCSLFLEQRDVIIIETGPAFDGRFSGYICSLPAGHDGPHRAYVGHDILTPLALCIVWTTDLIIEEIPI